MSCLFVCTHKIKSTTCIGFHWPLKSKQQGALEDWTFISNQIAKYRIKMSKYFSKWIRTGANSNRQFCNWMSAKPARISKQCCTANTVMVMHVCQANLHTRKRARSVRGTGRWKSRPAPRFPSPPLWSDTRPADR